jgi:ABC-type glycerol-3-phosphate transport system substrate-binding protein
MSHYYATNSERSEGNNALSALSPSLKYSVTTYPLPPGGQRRTFGGNHCFVIPTGAPQAEAAWLFLEHFLSPDNNLKFADRNDRVPASKSVALSERYIRGDALRKVVAEDMLGRRWLIPAPGAAAMRTEIMNVVADILDRGMPIQQSLDKAQRNIQQLLDDALRNVR